MTSRFRVAAGGAYLDVATTRINGGGPTVVFVHATGFCKEVWRPTLRALAGEQVGLEALRCDLPGHGGSSAPPHPFDWSAMAGGLLDITRGRRSIVGVGHSVGGALAVLAEALAPGTFRSLVLVEPILFPPPYERIDDHPLALIAEKRTRRFETRAAAAASFRGRGPFTGWDDAAFQGYIEGGLVPDPAARPDGVMLACDPNDEAEYYRTGNAHHGWSRMAEVAAPIKIVAGENSDTHTPKLLGLMVERMERATVTRVPNSDHFVPMQRPDVIAKIVAGAVREEWTA